MLAGTAACSCKACSCSVHTVRYVRETAVKPRAHRCCVHACVYVTMCRYPALQWQLRAARRALAAVAAAGPWLRDRVGATRYAHMQLAGLGRDALMSIADVLMSRRLREAGHVLWTADPALPDLGEYMYSQHAHIAGVSPSGKGGGLRGSLLGLGTCMAPKHCFSWPPPPGNTATKSCSCCLTLLFEPPPTEQPVQAPTDPLMLLCTALCCCCRHRAAARG
jgi:hypothetical protein